MRLISWPRALRLSYVLVTLMSLWSCGGGGDDAGGGGGGGGGGGTQTGRVWRSEYSTSAGSSISETVAGDGTVREVGRGEAVPWSDGSRFGTTNWDTTDTEVFIRDTVTGAQVRGVSFDGYVGDLKPSPTNPDVVALREGNTPSTATTWAIADFAQRTFLDSFSAPNTAFSWLPDGRYLTVSSSGEIRRGTVGQASTLLGQLTLPVGRTVANAWVNRQGTAMVLRLDLRPVTAASESDLWVANLDGSNFARFTATRMTTLAAWSPDGSRIAFDVDTGAWCTGSSCQGICEVWHAAASARDVRATTNSGDAQSFTRRENGSNQRLACKLRGWTP